MWAKTSKEKEENVFDICFALFFVFFAVHMLFMFIASVMWVIYSTSGMLPKAIVNQLKKGETVNAESFECATIYFRYS